MADKSSVESQLKTKSGMRTSEHRTPDHGEIASPRRSSRVIRNDRPVYTYDHLYPGLNVPKTVYVSEKGKRKAVEKNEADTMDEHGIPETEAGNPQMEIEEQAPPKKRKSKKRHITTPCVTDSSSEDALLTENPEKMADDITQTKCNSDGFTTCTRYCQVVLKRCAIPSLLQTESNKNTKAKMGESSKIKKMKKVRWQKVSGAESLSIPDASSMQTPRPSQTSDNVTADLENEVFHSDHQESDTTKLSFSSTFETLEKTMKATYEKMEAQAQDGLKTSHQHVSDLMNLMNQIHISFQKLETFKTICTQEFSSLTSNILAFEELHKNTLAFWKVQTEQFNEFCRNQRQRMEAMDRAMEESLNVHAK